MNNYLLTCRQTIICEIVISRNSDTYDILFETMKEANFNDIIVNPISRLVSSQRRNSLARAIRKHGKALESSLQATSISANFDQKI